MTEKIARIKRGLPRDLDELTDQAGRLIAVSIATSAAPYGIGNDSLLKGTLAVIRDIYRVYSTPSGVYKEILANAGKPVADRFYAALRGGNVNFDNYNRLGGASAADIMRFSAPRFGLAEIGLFDGGALHKGRRNNRGRISPAQKVLLVVTNTKALQEYIAKEVNKVGFGKAGWGNCARAFKDAGATRGLPQWVTRHRAAPSAVAKRNAGGAITVRMSNLVPYAQYLQDASTMNVAAQIAIERLVKGARGWVRTPELAEAARA